jgi:hypothetical protein
MLGLLSEEGLVPPANAGLFSFPTTALLQFPKNECKDFFFGGAALVAVSSLLTVLFSPAALVTDRGGTLAFEDDDIEVEPPDEKNDDIDVCLLCGWALRVGASPIKSNRPTRSDRASLIRRDTAT